MANVLVQESSLQAIAAAIRQQNGTQNTYTPAQMAPAILDISGVEPMEPHFYDLDTGYVNSGTWKIGGDTVNYSDVYAVRANRSYLLALGNSVGSRFRAMFSTQDISLATGDVAGTAIVNTSNPSSYAYKTYAPNSDGYITVTKDNAGTSGLKTYLFDIADLIAAIE